MTNPLPTMHVAICIPSGSLVHADFALSLALTMQFLCRERIPGYGNTKVTLLNKRSSILCASREQLAEDAIKFECTHMLFVDSDQCFPFYSLHQLAQHQKPVIGANIAVKMLPSSPSARNAIDRKDPVYSNGKEGLEIVKYLGFGLTLIDLAFLKTVPKPWFAIEYREGLGYVGEDLTFCDKVRAVGGQIWVDHDLSLEVGHIGDYSYGHDDIIFPGKNQ
jgi:hypothetical protein